MDFLGNIVDAEKLRIEVSEQRMKELRQELEQWIDRDTCIKKQLQSIIGKLSFITNCVRPGRIFINRMLETMRRMPQHGTGKVDEEGYELVAPIHAAIQRHIHVMAL